MKIFNVVKKVILVLSFVLFGAAFIVGAITLKAGDATFSAGVASYIVIGFVGFFLFFSKNKIAERIGMGITTGLMAVELFFAITLIESESTAAILGLVSVILYAIYFLVALIGRIAIGENGDNDPATDPKIKKILGWKELQEQGIISEAEFEEKRQEILGIKAKVEKK